MNVTTNDIQAYIAIAIRNNKAGVRNAMNSTGHLVPAGIASSDLLVKVWDVFKQEGIDGLQNVLSKVPVNPEKLSQDEAQAAVVRFRGVDPNAKFGDWIKGVGNYFGDLLGGSSVTGGTVSNMSSQAALSGTAIGLIVVIGLVLMILFRKSIALVVGIIVVILAVVLYGIFARTVTTTITGGGTVTHGGIGDTLGNIVSGWFSFLKPKK